ncbi:HNH endonuclease [Pandoraea sputorum]|uniref:HNH endonuclease n=1 Tax=Pandoraea sputorum TaxID=93222 RepID=UPI00123F6685|nr:HNH endonuclease [Pandoraea sputorum]VVE82362.1 HNH endonuclease [Pandoraea sputorum]
MIVDKESHPLAKFCIYCRKDKGAGDYSLEHIIPQFLGGAYAPDEFKSRDVCKRCNNDLGLFVDAGFEKDWFVTQKLRDISCSTFNLERDVGIPLLCLGASDLRPPGMLPDEVCEAWLGPLGEQVYLVRRDDERLFWYAGGNPRTAKDVKSRAYFMFSERSVIEPRLPWRSFRDAFEGRRTRKVMCTQVDVDTSRIGFSEPDELDGARIEFFLENCTKYKRRNNRISFYTKYDVRFMAKLAIGLAYAMFGARALETSYSEELYKALWHRPDDEVPEIFGESHSSGRNDPILFRMMGDPNAVTLAISPTNLGVAVNLNIGETMNWTIKCASNENIASHELSAMGTGFAIVLYRQLRRAVRLSMPELIAHKLGNRPHPELSEINQQLSSYSDFLKGLRDATRRSV